MNYFEVGDRVAYAYNEYGTKVVRTGIVVQVGGEWKTPQRGIVSKDGDVRVDWEEKYPTTWVGASTLRQAREGEVSSREKIADYKPRRSRYGRR